MAIVKITRTKDFVVDAAAFILEQARKAIAERNEFRIALSGGHTPAPVYAHIASGTRDFRWESVRFTFGDERCVPPDDPQSNFSMACENLFVPAAVPQKSIMRMRGEIDPQIAAEEYEHQLDAIAAESDEFMYQHDLILLGLGEDGHTASLFPGTTALEETARRVVANFVPKLSAWRLTFTCAAHFVSCRRVKRSSANRARARTRPTISRGASGPFRRRSDMDHRRVRPRYR